MIEEIIQSLPEMLVKHICTLRKTSKDDTVQEYMSGSRIKVVHYDKISHEYCKIKKIPMKPCSCDALYITPQNDWYFIEFKNGNVQKDNVIRKIYDSIWMLLEMNIIQDFKFPREHICYILVYRSDKYGKAEKSADREKNYDYLFRLAKQEKKLFELYKLENYLVKEAHTYTKEQFEENFIKLVEEQEAEAERCR